MLRIIGGLALHLAIQADICVWEMFPAHLLLHGLKHLFAATAGHFAACAMQKRSQNTGKGTKKQLDNTNADTNTKRSNKNEVNLMVRQGHPGHGYAYLEENSHEKIPLVSIPDGHLCPVKDLQLDCITVTDDVKNKRERYAKTALLLFYPFRCLEDL